MCGLSSNDLCPACCQLAGLWAGQTWKTLSKPKAQAHLPREGSRAGRGGPPGGRGLPLGRCLSHTQAIPKPQSHHCPPGQGQHWSPAPEHPEVFLGSSTCATSPAGGHRPRSPGKRSKAPCTPILPPLHLAFLLSGPLEAKPVKPLLLFPNSFALLIHSLLSLFSLSLSYLRVLCFSSPTTGFPVHTQNLSSKPSWAGGGT